MATPLRPGGRVLVCYDRAQEDLWHERLLLANVGRSLWVVCTPDRDIYLEDLASDVEEMRPLGPRGGLPRGFGGTTYRFEDGHGALTPEEVDRLLAEGRELAVAECERLGGVPPALGGDVALPVDGDPWVLLEDRFGLRRGEPAPGHAKVLACGDRGVADLGLGMAVAVGRAGSLGEAAARPAGPRPAPAAAGLPRAAGGPPRPLADLPREEDLRTLPVLYDGSGARFRDFRDGCELLTTTSFDDWKVQGPRTAAWLMREIARQGLTPVRRHEWWRSVLKLSPADWGVGEHESLSRILEAGLVYDQLNGGELEVVELAARRYQLVEEHYGRSLSVAVAGSDHEDRNYEESLFMGGEFGLSRSLVAPALQEWIAKRLQEEAAVLKERRKGREERQLARGGAGGQKPSHPPGGAEPAAGGKKK